MYFDRLEIIREIEMYSKYLSWSISDSIDYVVVIAAAEFVCSWVIYAGGATFSVTPPNVYGSENSKIKRNIIDSKYFAILSTDVV